MNQSDQEAKKFQGPITRARVREIKEHNDGIANEMKALIEENIKI